MLLSSDTPTGSKSAGLALTGFADALSDLKPDLLIILGDRYEMLAAVILGFIFRIPVAHLNGGELTEGAFDESIRHSITKMSHLHFTSTEEYRKRVIQLGESPDRVFNVGAIGLDNIRNMKLLSKPDLEKALDLRFLKKNLLITFHPVTLESNSSGEQFSKILNIIDSLKDTMLIFTKANADTGGRIINNMIDEYAGKNSGKSRVFTSMGQLKYLSTLQFVDAVLGNSSSGLVEAPSFHIGTINIGDRQKGRIKAQSVIDSEPEAGSINHSLDRLYSEEFRKMLRNVVNPYGDGHTAERVFSILYRTDLTGILKKQFFDLEFDIG